MALCELKYQNKWRTKDHIC